MNLFSGWGKVPLSLFTGLLQNFAFSSKIQFKTCYREEFGKCKIHWIVKIGLKLATFEEFETVALQTVAKRCLTSYLYDHFFESATETNMWEPKTSGITSNNNLIIFCCGIIHVGGIWWEAAQERNYVCHQEHSWYQVRVHL